MADHGENYKRMMGSNGEEIGSLEADCGHHCGVILMGGAAVKRHCGCSECHDDWI